MLRWDHGLTDVYKRGTPPLPYFCVSAHSKELKIFCFDTDMDLHILKGLGSAGFAVRLGLEPKKKCGEGRRI